jgi:hypothetical protein
MNTEPTWIDTAAEVPPAMMTVEIETAGGIVRVRYRGLDRWETLDGRQIETRRFAGGSGQLSRVAPGISCVDSRDGDFMATLHRHLGIDAEHASVSRDRGAATQSARCPDADRLSFRIMEESEVRSSAARS